MELGPKPGDDYRVMVLSVVGVAGLVRPPQGLAFCPGPTTQNVLLAGLFDPQERHAGKRCLLLRHADNVFFEVGTIIPGHAFEKVIEADGQQVRMELVLTSGHPKYRAELNRWARECDVFLICSQFEKVGVVDALRSTYEKLCQARNQETVPVVLVRTKSDLNLPFVEGGKVLKWAEQHGAGFVSTSAKTGRNVNKAFLMAAQMALQLRVPTPRR
jgi:GTPase SAR1 family protein